MEAELKDIVDRISAHRAEINDCDKIVKETGIEIAAIGRPSGDPQRRHVNELIDLKRGAFIQMCILEGLIRDLRYDVMDFYARKIRGPSRTYIVLK